MRLLLLGGTAFLGRAVARHALARGHEVTALARGTAPAPDGVRLVRADRDDDAALTPVAGEEWDAAIDLARQPVHVRRAVRDLRSAHWVFVSSLNVYRDFGSPEQDESGPTLPPLEGDVMTGPADYGPAKVACEDAVRAAAPSHTIVRAGLIGGDGDDTGRSGYYPWRFAHPSGPDVLVPPDLTFPLALIDAEDLAAWIVRCAEERVHGTFNAGGATITLGEFLDTARSVAGSDVPARPVPAERLAEAGVTEWMGPASLPLWISDPTWRHFATLDGTAARREGLRTRPLADTLAGALRYEESRGGPVGAGLADEDEQRLRALLG